MKIISFNSQTNFFTTLTYEYLDYDFSYFDDLNDLEKNIKSIDDNFLLIINRDYGLTNDFLKVKKDISKLKNNTILSSVNILTSEDRYNQKIIPFLKFNSTKNFFNRIIDAFWVKKEDVINILSNKDIKNYSNFSSAFDYKFISTYNIVKPITLINNKISDNPELIFSFFRNKKNVERVVNLKEDYNNMIKNNEIKEENKNYLVKIYKELHEYPLNVSIINVESNQVKKIILEYQKSNLNHKLNYLFLVGDKNLTNLGKINSKIVYINKFDRNIISYFQDIEFNYDVYFIDNLEKIKIIKNQIEKQAELYFDTCLKKIQVLKQPLYYVLFLGFEFNNFGDYLEKMGKILFRYERNSIYIHNYPNTNLLEINHDYKLKLNLELIDELYNTANYDECCLLINLIIRNQLSYNYMFIFKTLVLVDKINYIVTEKEITDLILLLENQNFEEIFQITVVLLHNSMFDIASKYFSKYLFENQVDEKDILKFIFLINKLGYLTDKIDLDKDVFLVRHYIKHIDYIFENIQEIEKVDNTVDTHKILIDILCFLNNRYELIPDKVIQKKISDKIKSIIFDYNDIDNISDELIFEKFLENPELVMHSMDLLSDIMMSENDIFIKRKNLGRILDVILLKFDDNKDTLIEKIDNPVSLKKDSLFRFSYHGLVNKKLFQDAIKLSQKFILLHLEKSEENFNIEESLFKFEPQKTNPKKICFLADYLTRKHSVFKDRHQVIINLIKKGFEVYIATFSPMNFKHATLFDGVKEHILLDRKSIFNSVNKLRSYHFDKLIFCEIGMDSTVVNMAYYRMANKQYNTWGHSDTSGFPEIDYFVSSELYELPYEESKEHYTEKLILQKGMCTSYVNPTDCYKLHLGRSFYGLSDFEKIICCPQSLFKIHPEFDKYLFEILKRNTNTSLVFLDLHEKKPKMYERWNKILKDLPEYYGVLSRVKFIPGMDHQKFCNLMKVSDVMIDPYPFGGCNSSLESLSLGKPLVTQPSIRINGRFTYGFYKRMGFMDLVANNMEEYVSLTTRLLQDKDFHQEMTDKILANKDKLFMDQQTLDEWEELMAAE